MEMKVMEGRVQRAAESILENESLAADLADPAAEALIAWGASWAAASARETASLDQDQSDAYLSPRLKATRRMLRYVNNWLQAGAGQTGENDQPLAAVYRQAQVARGLVADEAEVVPEAAASFEERAAVLGGDDRERILALRAILEEEADSNEAQGSL